MFDRIKNESGVAFAMVLILLILVGGLAMALLNSNVFNIRHSGNQVDRAQAFQAADSGIEYLKSRVKFELNQAETNEEDFSMEDFINNFLVDPTTKTLDDSGDINFTLSEEPNGNGNRITFKSVGNYRSQSQTILYDFQIGSSGKSFQVEAEGDPKSVLKSQAEELYPDHIDILPEIYPPRNFWVKGNDNFDFDKEYTEDQHGDFKGDYTSWFDGISDNNENFRDDFDNTDVFSAHFETSKNQGLDLKQQNLPKEYRIINSVIVVDGDLDINPQNEIINSVIVVKGNLKFNGAPTDYLENSMFFVYGEIDGEVEIDAELQIGGKGDFEDWSYDPPDLIIGDLHFVDDIISGGNFVSWRQIR